MNRQQRRHLQRKVRGKAASITIEVDPKIPKPLKIPMGCPFRTHEGIDVVSKEEVIVHRRWWWKVISFFWPGWKKKVKVEVVFP